MIRMLQLTALALLATVAAACGAGASASAMPDLPGTSWSVQSVGKTEAGSASPPTIDFGWNGIVSGTTGCNTYSGGYELDGARIAVGPLGTTLMLCEGPAGALEPGFTSALQGATAWSIGADGNLTLTGAGDIVATWVATAIP